MKKFKVVVTYKDKSSHFSVTSSDFGEALEKAEMKLHKEKKDWDEIDVYPEDWEPSADIKEQLIYWDIVKKSEAKTAPKVMNSLW